MQVVVLGMHRSGTSAVTGALNLMGAYFGPAGAGLEPNEENPKGYWERRDFHGLCNRLMRAADAQWWKVARFKLDDIPQDAWEAETGNWADIREDLDAHQPWVLKEPLLCVLLPLFLPQLTAPVAVHVNRDPLEIALSLQRRSGFPLQFGVALWEAYVRASLQASAGIPRVLIQYADLIADPKQTLEQLHDELVSAGVKGLSIPTDEQLAGFVSSDLYRQRSDPQRRADYLTPVQLELAEALDGGLQQAVAQPSEVSAGALDLMAQYEHAYALGREAAEREARPRVQKAKERVREVNQARVDAEREVRTLRKRVEALTKAEEAASRELLDLQELARARDAETAELRSRAVLADSKLRDANDVAEHHAAEIGRYRQQCGELERRLQQSRTHRKRLGSRLARAQEANQLLRVEAETATKQRRLAQKRYRRLQRRYEKLVRFPLIRLALAVRRRAARLKV